MGASYLNLISQRPPAHTFSYKRKSNSMKGKLKSRVIQLGVCLSVLSAPFTVQAAQPDEGFNKYILDAVEKLGADFGGKGYDIHKAYTHDFAYSDGTIKASSPPLTMCVAAVAEVIATAVNSYVAQTNDKKPYALLPAAGWNRMRPTDIRSHIWVDPKLDSYGTADALVTFGVGKRTKFIELTPGSFINLNRT